MPTGPGWERLSRYVISRRVALGFATQRAFAEETGLTERVIGKIETGRSVSKSTLAEIALALRWSPESPYSVMEGGEPEEAARTGAETADWSAAIARIRRDPDLPAEAKDAAITAIEATRERERRRRQAIRRGFPEAVRQREAEGETGDRA